jgi:hypothetical protein
VAIGERQATMQIERPATGEQPFVADINHYPFG